MEANNRITTSQLRPSFGAIKYDAAKDVIKKLSQKDLESFAELVKKQKDNSLVDVILFGNGTKKLYANVADVNTNNIDKFHCKSFTKQFFESPIGFIKRCCSNADKRMNELKEIQNKQELIDKLDTI